MAEQTIIFKWRSVCFYNHAAKLQKLQQMTNIWTITTNTYVTIMRLKEKHVQSYDHAVT